MVPRFHSQNEKLRSFQKVKCSMELLMAVLGIVAVGMVAFLFLQVGIWVKRRKDRVNKELNEFRNDRIIRRKLDQQLNIQNRLIKAVTEGLSARPSGSTHLRIRLPEVNYPQVGIPYHIRVQYRETTAWIDNKSSYDTVLDIMLDVWSKDQSLVIDCLPRNARLSRPYRTGIDEVTLKNMRRVITSYLATFTPPHAAA